MNRRSQHDTLPSKALAPSDATTIPSFSHHPPHPHLSFVLGAPKVEILSTNITFFPTKHLFFLQRSHLFIPTPVIGADLTCRRSGLPCQNARRKGPRGLLALDHTLLQAKRRKRERTGRRGREERRSRVRRVQNGEPPFPREDLRLRPQPIRGAEDRTITLSSQIGSPGGSRLQLLASLQDPDPLHHEGPPRAGLSFGEGTILPRRRRFPTVERRVGAAGFGHRLGRRRAGRLAQAAPACLRRRRRKVEGSGRRGGGGGWRPGGFLAVGFRRRRRSGPEGIDVEGVPQTIVRSQHLCAH
ncbi:unnamed protein product [Musa acuminata subsp. burmannicoides]